MGSHRTNNKQPHTKQARKCAKKSTAKKISKASSSAAVPKQPSKKKVKRTNHAKDPKLREALEDWHNTPEDERLTQDKHAKKHRVSPSSFKKYLRGERTLDRGVGRPSKVDDKTTKFLIQDINNHANPEELSNAKIANILQGRMRSMSFSAAMNYVKRTFKKQLNAQPKEQVVKAKNKSNKHQKPTLQHSKHQYSLFSNFRRPVWFRKPPPTKLDEADGYRFVQLPKGTSARLQSLVSEHVIEEENEQYVFTCNSTTYKRLSNKLSGKQKRQFTRLKGTKDSYTERSRRLENIHEDFNTEKVVSNILSTLRTNLDVQDHIIEEPVLLTTEKRPEWEIFRQQLHRDFRNDDDSSLFVIIPLCEDQTLYYEKNEGISSIKLSKDVAFVGHSQLIHAGSEQPGKRLHFKLVEEGQVEDTKTYFVKDSSYPRIDRILKF